MRLAERGVGNTCGTDALKFTRVLKEKKKKKMFIFAKSFRSTQNYA